jgi:hypothetical protein
MKHISHRLKLDFDTMGPTDPSGLDECQNSRNPKVNVGKISKINMKDIVAYNKLHARNPKIKLPCLLKSQVLLRHIYTTK